MRAGIRSNGPEAGPARRSSSRLAYMREEVLRARRSSILPALISGLRSALAVVEALVGLVAEGADVCALLTSRLCDALSAASRHLDELRKRLSGS